MKNLAIICFCIISLHLSAQINYPFTETSTGLPGLDGPISKWADYDNDGDMDLYLCGMTTYPNGISDIYRNNGNGTFTALGAGFEQGYGSADWGDFDCDGDADLMLTGGFGTYPNTSFITRLYRNDGAGVFTNYTIDVPGGFLAKWGDYDSDGDPDILINLGYDDNNRVEIYENKGSGTYQRTDIYFEKAETEFVSLTSTTFDWGDYNNDGFQDIVISGTDDISNEYCKIYRNNGNKTFTDLELILRGSSDGRVSWGDFDNDNDLDILLTGSYVDVLIYENEGNDAFSYFQVDLVNSEIGTWIDVNNDGNLDMIICGLYNSRIYTGDGTGSFEYLPCPLADIQHPDIDIADYDNDNDLDFVYVGYGTGEYSQIYQNNTSVVNHAPSIPTGLTARQNGADVVFSWNPATDHENGKNLSYNITVGTSSDNCLIVSPLSNLTNGKRLKLNRGNVGNDTTWILKNAPLGILYWSIQSIDRTLKSSAFAAFKSFEVKTPFSGIYFPDLSYNVFVSASSFIDINNDGLLDILVSGSLFDPTNEVDCFINQGNNTFTQGTVSGSKLEGKFIPCNLNGDSFMDALLYGRDNDTYPTVYRIYQLINNKSGGFTVSTGDFADFYSYNPITTGDLDNDGDEDIVIIGYKKTSSDTYLRGTYLFRKEGAGYSVQDLGFEFPYTDHSISACDIDNDLDLDIAYGPYILRNEGEFIQINVFPFKSVYGMDWGDFDGDGDLDVAIGGQDTIDNNVTKIYENLGNLNFSPLKIKLQASSGYGLIRWLDFNNDGLLDLTFSVYLDCYIYLNRGSSVFEETNYPGFNVNDWGDFDDDGDLDILSESFIYVSNGDWLNDPPSAPSGLTYTLDRFDVVLSWNRAEDAESNDGLSYNVKVGSSSGSDDIMQVLTSAEGHLRIPGIGNVQTNTSWRLKNLPVGTYYWSVQAVDQGYKGGAWAPEQMFTIFYVSADFTADTVCERFATQFNDLSVSTEGSIDSWEWDFGDGRFSDEKDPAHVYEQGGNYQVTLTAYSGAYQHSKELPVFVRHKPHAGFSASTVCEGSKTAFTDQSNTDSITVAGWQWNFGDGDVSTVQGDTDHPYLLPDTYNATLFITATNGCADSITKQVVVAEIPNKAIGLDYGYPVFCEGDSTQLSAEHNDNYNYQWKLNDFNITGATTSQLKIKNSGDYSVAITNPVGNCSVESEKKTITAVPTPDPPAVSVSMVPAVICSGESVQLSSTYNSNYQYQWRLNGGTIGADTNIFYAKTEGNYTLEVSVGDGCKSNPSAVVFVDVLDPPERPTIEVSGPTGFCEGDSVVLSITENEAYTYQWKSDYGYIAGIKGSQFTATESGSYSIEVTGDNGCKILSNPVSVISSTAPDPPTIVSGGSLNFCQGDSVELSTEYNSGYTYQWKYNEGNIGERINRLYARLEGTYKLQVEVAGVGECSRAVSNSLTVTTLDNPDKPSINLDGPAQICSGESVELSIPSSGGYIYQWKYEDNSITGATTSKYLVGSSGNYSIRIINTDGCSSESNPVQIVVSDPPPVSHITSLTDTIICQGETVSLEVPDNPQYTYQWKLNGIPVYNATGATYNAVKEGLYTVEIINNNCGVTTNTKEVRYKTGLPKPSLQAYGPNVWYFICDIEKAHQYRWYYNESLVESNDRNIYFAGTQMGEYHVEVNDGGECFVPSDKVVIPVISTGIDNVSSGNQMYIYPNPANGSIRILYSGIYQGRVRIKIISVSGGIAKEFTMYKDHVGFSEEIDLTGFKDGLYIVELIKSQYAVRSSFLIIH